MRTVVFLASSLALLLILPYVTTWFFDKYGGRVSELETKYILFLLFGMGWLAVWSGSEAVLPAYLIGMVLACLTRCRRRRSASFGPTAQRL